MIDAARAEPPQERRRFYWLGTPFTSEVTEEPQDADGNARQELSDVDVVMLGVLTREELVRWAAQGDTKKRSPQPHP